MSITRRYLISKMDSSKILLLVFSLILITSMYPQNIAQAQTRDCLSTVVTRVDADYNGPVFLDAYWTDRSASSVQDTLNPPGIADIVRLEGDCGLVKK